MKKKITFYITKSMDQRIFNKSMQNINQFCTDNKRMIITPN